MDSSIFGVSVRAWLAMGTVFSGLAFLFIMAIVFAEAELRLTIVTAVIGFVSLALGYYLGQKNVGTPNVRGEDNPLDRLDQ